MAIHIRDPETDAAVRKLAKIWGVSLTEAIKRAAEEAYAQKRSETESVRARIREIQERVAGYGRTGLEADKAFYDSLNDE